MESLIIIAVWYAAIYVGFKQVVKRFSWESIEGAQVSERKRQLLVYLAPFVLLMIQWIVTLEWLDVHTAFEDVLDFFLSVAQITGVVIFTILAYQTAKVKGWIQPVQWFVTFIGFSFSAAATYSVHPITNNYFSGYVYFGGMTLIILLLIAYGYYRYFRDTKNYTVERAQTWSAALVGALLLLSIAYKFVHTGGQFVIATAIFFISWYGMSFLLSPLSKGWRRAFTFQFVVAFVYLLTELYVVHNLIRWWNVM